MCMSMPPPLLEVVPFDRAPVLSRGEREALAALGWQLRRRRGHDAARPEWGAIGRLLAPLDAARLALRDRRDTPLHREFVARIGWLASGDGWRRRTTPSVTQDLHCAVQGQCHSPSPHSKAAAPSDELARV